MDISVIGSEYVGTTLAAVLADVGRRIVERREGITYEGLTW